MMSKKVLSFALLLALAPAGEAAASAAELFYERLFTLDPSLRPMFKGRSDEIGRAHV